MKQRGRESETSVPAAHPTDLVVHPPDADGVGHSAMAQRRAGPQTLEEAEERYVAARDAWTAAMRAANSGRPADMAALALAQEAYEAAANERERWLSGARVAIPVETAAPKPNLDAVVGNELRWRQIHTPPDEPKGLLGRLKRRISGR
jgi:hypothetical protein